MEAPPFTGSDLWVYLLVLAASMLLVAFFTSSEAVLIAVSKIRIRHLAEQGNRNAQAVQRVVAKEEQFFATVVLGQNLFVILSSSVGTALALALFGPNELVVIVSTLVMTMVVVIFGEMTPKTIAVQAASRYALLVARPLELVMKLIIPFAYLFALVPRGLMRLFGRRGLSRSPFVTEGELHMLIDIGEEEGTVEKAEATMLHRVFQFGDRHVVEVMVPRPDIAWVERAVSFEEFLSVYAQSSHSRFPVYEESVDNVVGILSIKDVLLAQAQRRQEPDSLVTDLVREAYFVPETKRVGELFTEMQATGNQMAIVVDEFGGVAGLVTLEQLVEEIVGSFGDELARGAKDFETIDEHTFDIDGGMRIDEANEELELGLPLGEYQTVAGFVLHALGRIPKEGDQLRHDGLRIIVSRMDGVKIERVTVIKG